MNSVISVSDFYFNYLRSDLVLKNVNIEIEKGSFTVIIGPSGAGKTTLCKAMTGIVPFYSGGDYAGEIKVLGESTKGKKVSDLAMNVGLMLEDYESQLVSLTAGEEVDPPGAGRCRPAGTGKLSAGRTVRRTAAAPGAGFVAGSASGNYRAGRTGQRHGSGRGREPV